MRPLRLRARNLRTFPELDLEFDTGVVGILGELRDAPEGADSNGAGKSTILEAIDIALFGRRSLASYLTRGGDVDELMVELTFEHAGETYRIRRTLSAKGRGKTSVDLERLNDDGMGEPIGGGVVLDHALPFWEPLTRASAKETDELLCEMLGLSKETFRDSAYLRQGDGGYADPDRDPRQRKQLLIEAVLGRDPVWPRLADQAKARRRVAEQQLERYRGETAQLAEQAADVETFERSLAEAERGVVTGQDVVSRAEQLYADIATRFQAAREQSAVRATLEAELATARAEFERLDLREATAGAAVLTAATVREELQTLATTAEAVAVEARERELVGRLDEYRAAAADHEAAKRDLEETMRLRAELASKARDATDEAQKLRDRAIVILEAGEGVEHCEMCKQRLGAEAAQEAALTLQTKARDLLDRAATLEAQVEEIAIPQVPSAPERPVEAEQELAGVRAALERAREQQAQRARLEERLVQLQRDIDARPPLDTITAARDATAAKERLLAELEPVDLATITREGSEARAHLDAARTVLNDAIATKARCEERLATIRTAQEKLAAVADATAQLQTGIDWDALLERAYGRDGIPALIIENTAIPSIEAEASRILRALGTSFDVELRTQAETKTGALRDTLEVVVIDQDGNEADYADGCSGGEQTRIGLALRIALARLLAARRGAESRLLALDEPSYLDAAGMAALLGVLRGLDGEFDLVLLVSHVAELRDALEDVIVVVKENGVSRIVGSPVMAEVAA